MPRRSSPPYEPGKDANPRPIYKGTNLTVTGASRERLIAMKLNAGRETDIDDLEVLRTEARIGSAEEARRIHRTVYGTKPMAAEADQYLIDRFVKPERQEAREPAPWPPSTTSAASAASDEQKGRGTHDR